MKRIIFILLIILTTLASNVMATGPYVDNGDNTVSDTGSGLMWQKNGSSNTMDKDSATSYCSDLTVGGYNDWRMPTDSELDSITEQKATFFNDPVYASALNLKSAVYWSTGQAESFGGVANKHYIVCTRNDSTPTPVDGSCGSANGGTYDTMPTTNLCSTGTASQVVKHGNIWTWTCQGENNGTDASCSANAEQSINGSCGSANGGTYDTMPTTNLCSTGTASQVVKHGNIWIWTCQGENNGVTANCRAEVSLEESTEYDNITPQEAVSKVETVESEITNEANQAEINIENITKKVTDMDKLVEAAVKNNATNEDLEKIASSANKIVDQFDKIADKIKNKDEGKQIVDSLGSIVNAGLIATLHSGAGVENIKKTVSKIDEVTNKVINTAANQVETGKRTEVLATVLEGAGNTFKNVTTKLNVSKNIGVVNTEVVEAAAEQLQDEAKNILTGADAHLKKVLEIAGTNSSEQTENVEKVSKDISNVMGSVLKITSKGLKKEIVSSAQELADNAFKLAEQDLLGNNFGSFSDNETNSINEIIKTHPEILNKILQKVSIDLSEGLKFDNTTLDKLLSEKFPELDLNSKDILLKGLPTIANKSKSIVNEGTDTVNANEIIIALLQEAGFNNITEKNTDTGEIVVKLNTDSGISVMVPEVKVVPTALSDGVYKLLNGQINIVKNGLGLLLNPGPVDSINLAKTLLDVHKSAYGETSSKNDVFSISPDGILSFDLNGGKLSAAFGYSLNYKNSLSGGTISYELQGNDPTSQSYSLLLKYEDGSFQSLPPMVSELDLLEQELEKLFGNNYSIDRDTGIIDLGDYGKLKADYYVAELTEADKSYFNANKDEIGIAWKVLDSNSTDVMLFQMITENSAQVLYYYNN